MTELDTLLASYGLTRLAPHLKEQGIENANEFKDLEAQDINEFVAEMASSGQKLNLGEKGKLRKMWKAILSGEVAAPAKPSLDSKNSGDAKNNGDSKSEDTLGSCLEMALKKLKLNRYAKGLASLLGPNATLKALTALSDDEKNKLFKQLSMKPGHRAKLLRVLAEQEAAPRYLCEFKVQSHTKFGKGSLGLGTELGHKGKQITSDRIAVKHGIAMYPTNGGEVSVTFLVPPDINSGTLMGSVALDDSQQRRAVGRGAVFHIRTEAGVSLWTSNGVTSKSEINQHFQLAWSSALGSSLVLAVTCKGMNLNLPAVWIDPCLDLSTKDPVTASVPPPPPTGVNPDPFTGHPVAPYRPPDVYSPLRPLRPMGVKKRRPTGAMK